MSQECVRWHLWVLRGCGFMRGRKREEERGIIRVIHAMYRHGVLAVTSVYLMQECLYAYRERSDMDKLARVLFLLLCHITSLAKQITFHMLADRVDRLVHDMNAKEFSGGPSGTPLISECTYITGCVSRLYAGCAFVTCMLWAARDIYSHADFYFCTGINTESRIGFILALIYSYYVTILIAIANTTMDAFIATILYHCKTQLSILRINFTNLLERADEIKKVSDEKYERISMNLFVDCLIHYKKICQQVSDLEDIFGVAILMQFTIGGWILCMAAYKAVDLSLMSVEFASMALFILCILTELFLYCCCGSEVRYESDQLIISLYSMSWEKRRREGGAWADTSIRRALLLSLLRCGRPIVPTAARLLPLDLDTFVKILRSSYTFYAVLRQTSN